MTAVSWRGDHAEPINADFTFAAVLAFFAIASAIKQAYTFIVYGGIQ